MVHPMRPLTPRRASAVWAAVHLAVETHHPSTSPIDCTLQLEIKVLVVYTLLA